MPSHIAWIAVLARRLPFYYGWVILFCACCAGFSRQGGAVASLSIFVEPMTREFGWSRTALSGAVSLGGLLAALTSPRLGRLLGRSGARIVLCVAVLTTGTANLLLSLTGSLATFYLLFCVARTNFAAHSISAFTAPSTTGSCRGELWPPALPLSRRCQAW